ncbi:MAG: hypothetical protein ACKO4T_02295 [Planctomycetaceae bacterium]
MSDFDLLDAVAQKADEDSHEIRGLFDLPAPPFSTAVNSSRTQPQGFATVARRPCGEGTYAR